MMFKRLLQFVFLGTCTALAGCASMGGAGSGEIAMEEFSL